MDITSSYYIFSRFDISHSFVEQKQMVQLCCIFYRLHNFSGNHIQRSNKRKFVKLRTLNTEYSVLRQSGALRIPILNAYNSMNLYHQDSHVGHRFSFHLGIVITFFNEKICMSQKKKFRNGASTNIMFNEENIK